MDKSSVQPTSLEELLRSTPVFTLIGCPEWCSWSLQSSGHEHVSDGVAELVLEDGDGLDYPRVLEVRHVAAPQAPQPR